MSSICEAQKPNFFLSLFFVLVVSEEKKSVHDGDACFSTNATIILAVSSQVQGKMEQAAKPKDAGGGKPQLLPVNQRWKPHPPIIQRAYDAVRAQGNNAALYPVQTFDTPPEEKNNTYALNPMMRDLKVKWSYERDLMRRQHGLEKGEYAREYPKIVALANGHNNPPTPSPLSCSQPTPASTTGTRRIKGPPFSQEDMDFMKQLERNCEFSDDDDNKKNEAPVGSTPAMSALVATTKAAAILPPGVPAPVKKNSTGKSATVRVKSVGGGDLKFTTDELESLMDIIEDVLPMGKYEWERVVARYNSMFPDRPRNEKSVCNQFNSYSKQKPPTGDPDCPPLVRKSKLIQAKIVKKAQADVLKDPKALAAYELPVVGGGEGDASSRSVLAGSSKRKKKKKKKKTASSQIMKYLMVSEKMQREKEERDARERSQWLQLGLGALSAIASALTGKEISIPASVGIPSLGNSSSSGFTGLTDGTSKRHAAADDSSTSSNSSVSSTIPTPALKKRKVACEDEDDDSSKTSIGQL
jgi:hypothetical protein